MSAKDTAKPALGESSHIECIYRDLRQARRSGDFEFRARGHLALASNPHPVVEMY